MLKRILVSCAVVLAAAAFGCGGSDDGGGGGNGNTILSSKPYIETDLGAIPIEGLAGAQGRRALQIKNRGQEDLVISSYTFTGDSKIQVTTTSPNLAQVDAAGNPVDGATLKSLKTGLIQLICQPTPTTPVTGTLVINSNAGNAASKSIPVSCASSLPDAGT